MKTALLKVGIKRGWTTAGSERGERWLTCSLTTVKYLRNDCTWNVWATTVFLRSSSSLMVAVMPAHFIFTFYLFTLNEEDEFSQIMKNKWNSMSCRNVRPQFHTFHHMWAHKASQLLFYDTLIIYGKCWSQPSAGINNQSDLKGALQEGRNLEQEIASIKLCRFVPLLWEQFDFQEVQTERVGGYNFTHYACLTETTLKWLKLRLRAQPKLLQRLLFFPTQVLQTNKTCFN